MFYIKKRRKCSGKRNECETLADRCHKLRDIVLLHNSAFSQILWTKWIFTHGYSNLVTSGLH